MIVQATSSSVQPGLTLFPVVPKWNGTAGEFGFAELDAEGRIWLPEELYRCSGLKAEVVVLGSFDRVEVWDPTAYQTSMATIEDDLWGESSIWSAQEGT
jgi:DNA-binding transcriptional regulator/RsmH inhibitor MraZ